jgi:hypothetical protein
MARWGFGWANHSSRPSVCHRSRVPVVGENADMSAAIWSGVIGVVGALGGSALTLVGSIYGPKIGWETEEKRLNLTHQHQLHVARTERQRELLAECRVGLHDARMEWVAHERWINGPNPQREDEPVFEPVPGRAWFEALRQHLQMNRAEIQALESSMDSEQATKLSEEIARIERAWGLVERTLDDPESRTTHVTDP